MYVYDFEVNPKCPPHEGEHVVPCVEEGISDGNWPRCLYPLVMRRAAGTGSPPLPHPAALQQIHTCLFPPGHFRFVLRVGQV